MDSTAVPVRSIRRGKVKSGHIKPEFESVGELAAPDYCSHDRAQNHLPPISLFRRKGIQIARYREVSFAHVHIPGLFNLGALADSLEVFLVSSCYIPSSTLSI
jgi:hypothetical protein